MEKEKALEGVIVGFKRLPLDEVGKVPFQLTLLFNQMPEEPIPLNQKVRIEVIK